MTSSRFNQDPDADYGKCVTCSLVMKTEQDADEHMHSTFEESKRIGGHSGHGITVTNPDRQGRIDSAVAQIIDDAIEDALTKVDYLADRGHITHEEATEALRFNDDFLDEWKESWSE